MAEPTNELEAKLHRLNDIRDRSWVGVAASAAPTLNAARKGGDPLAVAKSFQAKGSPKQDPLTIIGLKKDIITKMAADAEDVRAGKLQLGKAFQNGSDLTEKILATASSFGGAQASAYASVQNNYRDNIRALASDTSKTVVQALGTVDEGSASSVGRALDELRAMMAAGGTVGPEFSAALASKLTGMRDERSKAYLMEALNQDPGVQAQGGLKPILEGMQQAGDQPASNALQVWTANQSFVDEVSRNVTNLPMAMFAATVEQMTQAGTLGAGALGKNIEEITATLRELGLADDPASRERIFDKLMAAMRPSEKDPDAQKKFDKLLEDLDKPAELLDPTRRQAKQDLMSSPDFKAWMEQNGYTDPSTALSLLRQHVRHKVAGAAEHDKKLAKSREGAVVDTTTGASTLTQVGSTTPKAPVASSLEPGPVMGKDGMPMLFTGTELVPLDGEGLQEFSDKMESDSKFFDAYMSTDGRLGEYEGAVAKSKPAAAPGAPEEAVGLAPATAAPTTTPAAPVKSDAVAASEDALLGLFNKGKKKKEEERAKTLANSGLAQ